GLYAGLSGLERGYFEVLQGNAHPGNYQIAALEAPCVAEEVWNGCQPAISILPSDELTGALAMTLGVTTIVWALGFVHLRYGGPVLMLMSSGLLLFGGGLLPPFVGFIGGGVSFVVNARICQQPNPVCKLFARLWPWPL